uniref:Conjugal transfer protein TrbC n=1 Tax=Enterovibrio norvegicus TaxID=188144 RepID=A0A0H4A3Z9_9GAMM|nr:hypothetical protein [Enterovibrio norvegicus]
MKLRTLFNKYCAVLFVSISNFAYAAGSDADAVLEDLNEKVTGAESSIRTFGWSAAGLAFTVCGLLAMGGKFPKEQLKNVVIGCCIIIAATEFVAYMQS